MATAHEERTAAARGEGCLGKADANEPVFTLRGQDRLAPVCVRQWAAMLRLTASSKRQLRKAQEAEALADRMEAWGKQQTSKIPD